MKLVIVSHKLCWRTAHAASGYASSGGFPAQVRALSELFDRTTLVTPSDQHGRTSGGQEISGHELAVQPLQTLPTTLALRRRAYPVWLSRNGLTIWKAVCDADAVYAPIPGDVGTFGLLVALVQRKRLFVRYCGDWSCQTTYAQRFWKSLLERAAGGSTVVMVSGDGRQPPSPVNRDIRWIFATALTKAELATCRRRRAPTLAAAHRLIIVCRQDRAKGTDLLLAGMPHIAQAFPSAHIDVVGDGRDLSAFKAQVQALGIADAVTFHGQVTRDRVLELMCEADLFCFPSEREGFPKAIVDALACGLPIVATPVSVVPALAEAGCAAIISRRTPEAVVEAVVGILSKPSRYAEMSARAIEAAGELSLERWQDDIASALEAAWGPLKSGV